ncbi:unnamed protein product [Symbiodinium necroappetens]|uniref:EamA domain-containing protein n=1 Tax=Symbiodinium necroappetens TaxID=1628268 RepID=A0A812THX4_9DINO|nr:unnamed protein product [Symbiodinium necroappetens]|mmetsp:Transcript_93849/g.223182  ORF Transcript_93849/g.223182 Transcript_93849/m.223182 type:complete len:358 (-) Transcript_93849:117-1190(-)|eukprot:CAMPEP_0181461896 /NCGR_PEP_ID=MMETSP1110-20121109/34112_1 /TAXON_ID=174948 /ORGANISM="Symbiodinium sp., Strain CCMP421" /LENGTH=357 /DNA_ID=CAMNT_0023586531 /DNA_START=69 /DNA_END=1142 /DNA_ORIENTATION=+
MALADLQHSAAAAVTGVIFLAICFILRKRPLSVIVMTCLFVASLVVTQILMSRLSSFYKHPGAVTTLHFVCVWVTCCIYWTGFGTKANKCEARTNEWFVRNILPIALSNPLTVVFNNTALVYAGAGVCAILGTLSPVSVAVLSYLVGRRLSLMSWFGVSVACCGALLIAAGEVKSIGAQSAPERTLVGILFALASVGTRSLKIVVMDFLLAPMEYASELSPLKEVSPMSPMQLYSLQAPWCVLTAFVFAVCTDSFPEAFAELTRDAAVLISFTCVSAVALNFLGVFVLKELGASSQQILGKLNTLMVGAISVGYLNEKVSMTVLLGSGVVLSGAFLVELGKEGLKKDFKSLPEPSKV